MSSQADEMMALLGKVEALDPELQRYLKDHGDPLGLCLQHPLVYSMMHVPGMNAYVNKALRSKQAALAEAEAEEDWYTYVFLHERPWRVKAFIEVMGSMTDAFYWDLLGIIWIDSENIRQSPQVWHTLLRSERGERDEIMDDDERADLAAMDDVIPVYQGHTATRDDGWSWTIDRSKAEWFAQRFARLENDRPRITEGRVKKSDVIAYFTGRNESEILAPRAKVTGKVTKRLEPEPERFA